MTTMKIEKSFFSESTSIKIWRLYLVRFLLFFSAWAAVSMAFELPSGHLFLRMVARAFIFSVLMLLLLFASERLSATTRRVALTFLVLLGILLVVEVWRGGATLAKAPTGRHETSR